MNEEFCMSCGEYIGKFLTSERYIYVCTSCNTEYSNDEKYSNLEIEPLYFDELGGSDEY